jgi:stearoyl-CoA desaturase (delta-9 desaturase)
VGTPDDWVERKVYTPYPFAGVGIMLLIDLYAFGLIGLVVWLVQMAWIPFWAAGVVNGLGHWCGYKNNQTADHSCNISPIGFIIGGEELHNNHHNDPANPRLSLRWFELDIGWIYLKLFSLLGLAKIKNV